MIFLNSTNTFFCSHDIVFLEFIDYIFRTLYNEWVFCLKQTSGDEEACKKKRWLANNICPNEWMERWDDEREEGKFAGIQIDEE